MSVQYHFPPNRLTDSLKSAKYRSLEQGLRQADENLKKMSGACLEHIDGVLAQLEEALSLWPSEPDEAYLSRLYQLTLRIVGVGAVAGLPDLDQTARSLCDVIDGMTERKLWAREPVAVHVKTMHLLRRPELLGTGLSIIVDGLLKVRNRFAPPPASFEES